VVSLHGRPGLGQSSERRLTSIKRTVLLHVGTLPY
jgi:hypothetical protein